MNDRLPATAPRSGCRVTALAAAVALVAVLATGCAALPTSGQPQAAKVPPPRGGGISPCCGVNVGPPQPDWTPTAVVTNFLLASLIPAHNYGVARTYLTKSASASWHPGSEVAILTGTPTVKSLGRLNGPGGGAQVEASGQKLLATLNSSGQYIPAASGAKASPEVFQLQSESGTYKISTLPPAGSGLLITSDLFHLVYAPRNLYYYGLRDDKPLPDPVYVPIQGANQVETLVNDLRHQPAGSLEGAARTYFPAGAHLAGPPQVFPGPSGGRTALVNIALPQGTKGTDVARMVTQLVCTLTSPVFGPPLFHAVRIKINGQPWAARKPAQNLASYESVIPHWPSAMTAYYLASDGNIHTLGPKPEHEITLPKGPAGQPLLSQIAVSPDGKHLAGLDGAASTVYTGDLGSAAKPGQRSSAVQLQSWFTGTSFSSMSWDALDDLWVVGQVRHSPGVWVLMGGQGEPQHVRLPHLPGRVTSLRVAPDGVRVAMIVGTGAKAQVWLGAAMRGSDGDFAITKPVPLGGQGPAGVLTRVSALTWYDEYHLLAVAGAANATQLWDVPTDGENPAPLPPKEAGMTSVTAAGPGNPFYLGFSNGRLEMTRGLNQLFSGITAGQAPAYPG